MKYSFMSFSCLNLSLAEMLDEAARHGYDAVEPRLATGHMHGIELECSAGQRKKIRHTVAQAGINLACLATGYVYSNLETVHANIENTKRVIDLAAEVGAPRIRVFGGAFPEGFSRSSAMDLLVDSLISLADFAKDHKITLCMETHDSWCDPSHVAGVMSRVNHPAVAVTWDIIHPILRTQYTIKEAFEILQPWIQHVHIHDILKKGWHPIGGWMPIGEGEVDHREVISLLISSKYDGYLSGEWIEWNEDPYSVYLPRELLTMKRYEREIL